MIETTIHQTDRVHGLFLEYSQITTADQPGGALVRPKIHFGSSIFNTQVGDKTTDRAHGPLVIVL